MVDIRSYFGEVLRDVGRMVGFLMAVFLIAVPLFTHFRYSEELESKLQIINYKDSGVTLLDRKGREFFRLYDARDKKFVPIGEIPVSIQHAVVSIEDHDFYKHKGISVKAIARSLLANIKHGDARYGGSTITQQLVKSALLYPHKSVYRKYQEMTLAREIENKYTKSEILEMYLNSVYFGSGAFGINQAADVYFNKKLSDLTISESALLIGLLPSPSRLSPFAGNLEASVARQQLVLRKMYEEGYITGGELESAKSEKLVFVDGLEERHGTHFAFMVRDELISKYGEELIVKSGFKVRTTIDLDWQEYAQKSVTRHVKLLEKRRVSNGAAVVMDPKTGEIMALVGSQNWDDTEFGKVNVATSLRQPWSAFKPIVYASAFEKRAISPATQLSDEPIEYPTLQGPYRPHDYDGQYRGKVLARRALANSLNIPAVEVINKIGVDSALEMAGRLGISSLYDTSRFGLSLVLGTGEVKLVELVGAYSVFANEGNLNKPVVILDIKDKYDNNVFSYRHDPKRVLAPEVAFLISSVLSDSKARSEMFGSLLNTKVDAAVKTGTTQTYRDSWTVGYTPDVVVGVWVGNNNGRPMDQIAGSVGAAPIWKDLIERFSTGTLVSNFERPEGVIVLNICNGSGLLLPKENPSAGYSEYFLEDTVPLGKCALPPTVVLAENPTSPIQVIVTSSDNDSKKKEKDEEEHGRGGI